MNTPNAVEGFSLLRTGRLLLATATMAFVFALPGSLHLVHELLRLI